MALITTSALIASALSFSAVASAQTAGSSCGVTLNFASASTLPAGSSGYSDQGVSTASTGGDSFSVTETNIPQQYGWVQANIPVNLTTDPYVQVDVTSLTPGTAGQSAQWALIVYTNSSAHFDITPNGAISTTGVLTYDLAKVIGETGQQTLMFQVYSSFPSTVVKIGSMELVPTAAGCSSSTASSTATASTSSTTSSTTATSSTSSSTTSTPSSTASATSAGSSSATTSVPKTGESFTLRILAWALLLFGVAGVIVNPKLRARFAQRRD